MIKVSDYIAQFIVKQGVTHVFEMAGGMITHLLDSLHKEQSIEIISMHHEQAAAFAADGYARIKDIPGVALATSGPGATNLLTGVGNCYFDSVPAVFITGQVNTNEQKQGRNIRQLGFQETDICEMAKPITKKVFKVEQAGDIPQILTSAFALAREGRPGPVLIDIPMDIQRQKISSPEVHSSTVSRNVLEEMNVDIFFEVLVHAQRPLILAGHGVRSAQGLSEFHSFIEKIHIPVVLSLLGLDILPYDHRLRIGFIGSYGNRWANIALGEADVLLVLGSRLDIRQTGADTASFENNKVIFHVDCEPGEINNRFRKCISMVGDVKFVLQELLLKSNGLHTVEHAEWFERITFLKKQYPDTEELKGGMGINPNKFIHELTSHRDKVQAYIADVGNHQMWFAQSAELMSHQFFLTSGGMGAMGYALPASIGATFGLKRMPVVVVMGDGGGQVNIQELETIMHHKLPIKIIVLNNHSLGMIRQFQDSYFEKRYQSTVLGYSAPDFEKIAMAYGWTSRSISSESQMKTAFEWLFTDPYAPQLLQVHIDTQTNVYPKIAFGKPISEMEPFSKPLDMEGA